jgi:hypothetical protein
MQAVDLLLIWVMSLCRRVPSNDDCDAFSCPLVVFSALGWTS